MHVIGYMCSYITLLSLQPQNVWSLVGDHNSFTYNGELQRKSYSPICDVTEAMFQEIYYNNTYS